MAKRDKDAFTEQVLRNEARDAYVAQVRGEAGDPDQGPSVIVELNATCAQLLAKLCVELGAEDDPVGVISRALGLLEMVQRSRTRGGRLCFVNERGEQSDVVL
jgi:hypothetical protein